MWEATTELVTSCEFWGELVLITSIVVIVVLALTLLIKGKSIEFESLGKSDFWKEVGAVVILCMVLTVFIGFLVSSRMTPVFKNLGIEYENNRALIMTSVLAITGALVGAAFHIGFEVSLLNKYYCNEGVACQ